MQGKIIYIIGAGRSGTTLLDIILGNASDVFSAGELNRFAKRGAIPHDARDETVAGFWNDIKNDLAEKNITDFELYNKLSNQFEYHTAALNVSISKKNKDAFNLYADFQKKLFSSILKQASGKYNKNIILDSSKYPVRGYMLSKIFGSDISFVYIQRNPAAVVESFQKKDVEQPPKNRLTANIYVLTVNMIADRIIKRLKKSNKVVTITYDDLVAKPSSTLSKIEKSLDVNLQQPKKLIEEDKPLLVGFLFDGNRLRLKNEISFNKKSSNTKTKKILDKVFDLIHKLIWYKKTNN